MKKLYPLKKCPFCKKTPEFKMWYNISSTWLPRVMCNNPRCFSNPSSKYVPIRKQQKNDPEILQMKIEKSISIWNDSLDTEATEGIILDFHDIAKNSTNSEYNKMEEEHNLDSRITKAINLLNERGYEIIIPTED